MKEPNETLKIGLALQAPSRVLWWYASITVKILGLTQCWLKQMGVCSIKSVLQPCQNSPPVKTVSFIFRQRKCLLLADHSDLFSLPFLTLLHLI